MNRGRCEPLRELGDVSGGLHPVFRRPPVRGSADGEDALLASWAPAVDVRETDSEYLVKAYLPQVSRDDLKVQVRDGVLSVCGERRQEQEEKGKRSHDVEGPFGRFERRLAVPTEVDAQKIAAEFKEGVLHVHLPKSPSAKPETVEVRVS